MKEIRHCVGILCKGFVEEFLALLTAVEAGLSHSMLCSSSKLGGKENREFKRLSCSINNDSKGGSTCRGNARGRALIGFYEA